MSYDVEIISFNWTFILSNLRELADESYQRKLWTGQIAGKQSNFTEVFEQLFGDSNFDSVLATSNKLFDQKIINKFRRLDSLMQDINERHSEIEILDDPKMIAVRSEARSILNDLEE